MFFKKATLIFVLAMLCTPTARAGDAWAYVLGGAILGAGLHGLKYHDYDQYDEYDDDDFYQYHHRSYYQNEYGGVYYPAHEYTVYERRTIYLRGGYQSSPRHHEYHRHRHHDWR